MPTVTATMVVMTAIQPILVFSPRFNETARTIAGAAERRGLRTETLSDWRVPEHLRAHRAAHLYAGPLYADAFGAAMNLALLQPGDGWLASLPHEFTRREIKLTTIGAARMTHQRRPRRDDSCAPLRRTRPAE